MRNALTQRGTTQRGAETACAACLARRHFFVPRWRTGTSVRRAPCLATPPLHPPVVLAHPRKALDMNRQPITSPSGPPLAAIPPSATAEDIERALLALEQLADSPGSGLHPIDASALGRLGQYIRMLDAARQAGHLLIAQQLRAQAILLHGVKTDLRDADSRLDADLYHAAQALERAADQRPEMAPRAEALTRCLDHLTHAAQRAWAVRASLARRAATPPTSPATPPTTAA